MIKMLIDRELIYDILVKNPERFELSREVLLAVARKKCIGCITTDDVQNFAETIEKRFQDHRKTREILRILLQLFTVLSVSETDCKRALSSMIPRYDMAVKVELASRVGLDGIVTGKREEFLLTDFAIYTPELLIEKIRRMKRQQEE